MKKIICLFMLCVVVSGLFLYFTKNNDVNENIKTEEVENSNTEIVDKKMNINGQSNITVPQIKGDGFQEINKMIIEKIKLYIDQESDLWEFQYIVEHNDGRYVSIITEMIQFKESLPHPGKQAHAINIDIKEKRILSNNDLVSDRKTFCEDIKNGGYVLQSEISNNIADSSSYIENQKIEEIEDMYDNKMIEVFMTNQSLGFIAVVPYGIGNYAIFERQ